MSISKTAYYYKPKHSAQDKEIAAYLCALAEKHKRWGFDKMMLKIKNEKLGWNHKRAHRIYCENKLNIRVKPRKRIPSGEAKTLVQPLEPNVCWSMDFMSDALSGGRRIRTLNVIDDYNREGLLIRASYSISSRRVIEFLEQLALTRGYPDVIRVDNGPEFRSSVFKEWASRQGILIHYIQPGKPAQNAFIERFNRTYRTEILDMNIFNSLREVAEITEAWLKLYNEERPHESLAGFAPSQFSAWRNMLVGSNQGEEFYL
jgi:putative transposase